MRVLQQMRAQAKPDEVEQNIEKAVCISVQNDHVNTLVALLRSASRAGLAALASAGFRVAARHGSTGALRILLDAKANVNHDTAWTAACAYGHADTAAVLLEFKACVDLGDPSPLALAVRAGEHAVVQVLLRFKAAANGCAGYYDLTMLQIAAGNSDAATVQMLLDGNADANFMEHGCMDAPLALAASTGHDGAVRALLKGKAAINHGCEVDGSTALHVAAGSGRERNLRVVNLLLEAGADVNAADLNGETPLMCASRAGSCPTVHVLLESKADATRTDFAGRTALCHAYLVTQGGLEDPNFAKLVSMLMTQQRISSATA